MEVQEILENKGNLIKFLKEIGIKEESDYIDEEYKEGTYFKIGKRKLLVVYEIVDEERLKEIKDHFLIDRGLSYCIILFNHKLIFFRNFGEIKHFIYSERTKDNISKIDKLKEIGTSMDGLFQTKDISAQFYEAFKLKRNLLVQHIKNNIEPTEKYLISQKIFDRFFFIYFLCHKGIINFKDGGKISGENLFSKILLKNGNFLDNLRELFHKFNLQGENNKRILKIGDYDIFIPYLNGGLFRPDVLEQNLDISLINTQWEDIFEFLNSYHWIIEDVKATEEDEDKILTPEILGHVYERSVVEWEQKGFKEEAEEAIKKITERKRKGVYYTPASVTDYISNNTIIPYLLDKLDNIYSSFDELIESKNKVEYKKAISILNEIKVLDPACGSGAFLIKASEVIFGLKRRLSYLLKEKLNPYDLKLNIITENIYGIDILVGAIEISKLRLWLWLISDFDSKTEVEPLPNIEYNLMCGNSLVGFTSFMGKLVEVSKKLIEKTERFEKLKNEYKTSHGKKSDLIGELLEKEMNSVRSELNGLFIQDLNSRGLSNLRAKKDAQFNFFGKEIKSKDKKCIYKEQFEKELFPFHWVLEFSHIFKGKTPGFDVVIGNPPYVSFGLRDVGKLPDYMKSFYNLVYSNSSEYKINIYSLFMQRGIDLTKETGRHSFIVPDSFLLGRYFSKIRKYILEKCKIHKILYLPYIVFPGATIGISIMYVFEKNSNKKNNFVKAIFAIDNTQLKDDGIKSYSYPEDYFRTIEYNRFRLFFDKSDMEIIKRVDDNSKHLSAHFRLYSGCIARYGQESLISQRIKNMFIIKDINNKTIFEDKNAKEKWKKTLISGGQFDRYTKIDTDYFIYINKNSNVIRKITKSGFDFELYENEKLFLRQTGDHITATYDNTGCYCLNNVHLLCALDNQLNLKYLLAILNSKFMDFYYKKISLEEGRTMAQTDIETLEKLPIKEISEKDQQPFIKLVDKILSIIKSKDYSENKEKRKKVKELQDKIDQLVYKLYDLTPEEIKIVKDFCEGK